MKLEHKFLSQSYFLSTFRLKKGKEEAHERPGTTT